MTEKTKKKVNPVEEITSFKGFNDKWECRGFKFKPGETFHHDGQVKACESGFHACEYPLDVFNYYPPAGSRFAVVKQYGDLSRHDGDTKVSSKSISIMAEINIAVLVKAAIEYTTSRCKPVDHVSPASATGYQGAASATGDYGAASATGARGAASATGYQGAASVTGASGAASATGDYGAASATGASGAASATGYQGAASATGASGAASATGYQGAASATGDQGAASATGYRGAASATGDYGAASATGARGAASATGYQGAASATGESSVAAATGWNGRAQGAEGCAIVLVHRDDYGKIIHIRASKVGDNGIKPGVWYKLSSDGHFVEITQP